jgi:hypothetical protein
MGRPVETNTDFTLLCGVVPRRGPAYFGKGRVPEECERG